MSEVLRKPNTEEEARKKECLAMLSEDRRYLLMRWPFIGGIILRMDLTPVRDDRLGTACTDGNSIFVDIDFYSGLCQEERVFVLAHEVWHCVFLHLTRKKNRDHETFNIAADLEIHFALQDEGMQEPYVLPHNPKWKGLSAEEIYERLLGKGCKEQSRDGIFDQHIYQGEQSFPDPERMEPDGDDGIVIDPDFTPAAVSGNTVEQIRGRVIASAQQVEKKCGRLPAGAERILHELRTPSIPWQEVLKQFVTSCYGGKRRWLPPARRHVWQGLYLPSMRSEFLEAVVAIDTSGSTGSDLDIFLGELVSLLRSFGKFELTVIQCDAKVQQVDRFTGDKAFPAGSAWRVKGGGGTSFIPVFEYVKQHRLHPDVLLCFTDGFGSAPDSSPSYPVMWVLTEDGRSPCTWGRKIFLKKGCCL